MNSKRTALALSAVLAATVLTGGAAILGMNHTSVVAAPSAPAAVVHQAPAHQSWEEGDR